MNWKQRKEAIRRGAEIGDAIIVWEVFHQDVTRFFIYKDYEEARKHHQRILDSCDRNDKSHIEVLE